MEEEATKGRGERARGPRGAPRRARARAPRRPPRLPIPISDYMYSALFGLYFSRHKLVQSRIFFAWPGYFFLASAN